MTGCCQGCGTAAAWWQTPTGDVVHLCRPCLDGWFDQADDRPAQEPLAWGWLTRPPSADQLAAALRDPRNRRAVVEVLRQEARIDPQWWADLIRREMRIQRGRLC